MGELAVLNRGSLSVRAYQAIRHGLMCGSFRPGQVLLLRPLAAEFGISITPVREALLQLVSEQALVADASRSIRVPLMSRERLLEIRDLRVNLEGQAGAAAVAHLSDDSVDAIERIHEELIRARSARDWRTTMMLSERFHFEIYRHAGMPVLYRILELIWVQLGPAQNETYDDPPDHPAEQHRHLDIIKALRARDPERVRHAIAIDVLESIEFILRRLDRNASNDAAPLRRGRRA